VTDNILRLEVTLWVKCGVYIQSV